MNRPETRIDYARRIARVGEHIAEHLDAPLDVERLATVAHFSPWHFHRIYREATGETPADTVRRLRLHRAAVELTRDDAPLERVARRAGYGTLAAFSRAFAADYGMPPGAWRRHGRLHPPAPTDRQVAVVMHTVEIMGFRGLRLAAVAHRGDYQEIGRAFERLYAWAGARGLTDPATRSFGIYYDDPESVPRQALRAHAGIAVDVDTALDDAVQAVVIPPLFCASVVHKGPYADLEKPYRYLYRAWLPQAGYEPDDHPCFEEYLNNARELPPSQWLTRVHLPIRGEPE